MATIDHYAHGGRQIVAKAAKHPGCGQQSTEVGHVMKKVVIGKVVWDKGLSKHHHTKKRRKITSDAKELNMEAFFLMLGMSLF